MESSNNKQEYTPLNMEALDLEYCSDSTLTSDGKRRKTSLRRRGYPRFQNLSSLLVWFRWATITILQTAIIILLLRNENSDREVEWKTSETETGGDVNGLYIPKSHTYTILTSNESAFIPDMASNVNRMEVRKNWDLLMPLGSGSVAIPEHEQYPLLGKPILDDPIRSGPLYEASWTHALHCLYYSVDTYHQLVVNGSFGFDGERNDDHAAHCFEYLRNQILCSADMTLEGSESLLDSRGGGQAHMCRNRKEAIAWIETRRLDDIQSITGP
ncbi:hypothetical protein BT63DRAFT_481585 [Microthyrium microscopicum]|uniref:Uncharacterized protein n=1 Tax=Microthyrium microscopicum TaxID=703497 RepID=A0A6A6U4S9_9PEZI|nr:hypothetical protein BT63DRAFT_481585 [Microthyrium microscopicum]